MAVVGLFKIVTMAAKGVQLTQWKFVSEIVKPSDKSIDERSENTSFRPENKE